MPVFLVGALEDEGVGPLAGLIAVPAGASKDVFVTMMNRSPDTDSLGPDTIQRWLEFLDI